MKKQYQQLTIVEREKIQILLWEKKSFREIGQILGRDHTTISREANRNKCWSYIRYTPHLAQEKAQARIQTRGRRPRLKSQFIREYVRSKLKIGWSPEQISGRLSLDSSDQIVSPEAIYQYIYAPVNIYGFCREEDLRVYLCRANKRRQRRFGKHQKRPMIPNRIDIEKRPSEVEKRRQLGHWEGDSMVSRKSLVALNTLVERVSGLAKITKLPNLKPLSTAKAMIGRLEVLPRQLRLTITLDNGIENTAHETVTEAIDAQCYFAHPYHSWERGTNENTNGLIRWYLPKGTDFARVSEYDLVRIEHLINTRPRKRLHYKTPLEVFTSGALKG